MKQERHDPYQVFRIPAFRSLLLGGVLVNVGTAAQSLAIGWEMYQRTDQAMMLGLIGLAQAVPMLLFTLPAGYLADVFDRRKVMIAGLIGTTLTSLALALFSHRSGSIGWMYLLLFLDASFHRVATPARTALLPLLVPADQFEGAVKWRTTLFQLSMVVGPAVGGFIITWSIPSAYLFSAFTTIVYILLLLSMRIPESPRTHRGQMFKQVLEGIRFVWNRKLILGSISLDLFAVFLGGAVYLLPIFARDIIANPPFGFSPEEVLGWLRAAPAAGSIVMALILAHRPPLKSAGRSMFSAVAAFGAATVVFGLSRNFWLSWAMLFLTGFFDNISVVVRQTLVQMRTPNHMRGRVSAVNFLFIGSSNELGGFESGLVAQLFSPVISVVSGGIGTLVVVLTWLRLFPGLRRVRTLSDDGNEK
ncbi:MAG TPA: MFS transporter [Candidatus Sabulitectum sp.]|nr:MFS transporter [Candidatus Sabulitectum sp.]HPF33054.1 MFS transporter [Candidatus Sabulitectum sp.]HPJ28311.1 MFS transporter [Candidatus Sabulitectum sp.]HPR22449.1 MFS transporter [Candidatus Sabulitectum sp.]